MASAKNRATTSGAKKSESKCVSVERRQQCAIFENLNNMRKEDVLCDVTLVVQGKHFPAHRNILAAASHYFRLMFTTNMIESTSQEVILRSVEPNIIELLIEFIYTERISVNSSNVQPLLDAANQYQIEPVKKMCVDFLMEHIDIANCIGILDFADHMNCQELKEVAEDFVLLHFTDVYTLDEFLKLDVTQITYLLLQDKLTVTSEAQVYDAVMLWLKYDIRNRQQYMAEVLSCVRFTLVSKTFLSKTVQVAPLIQDNPQCLKMVITGMGYHLASEKEKLISGESIRPRRKKCNVNIAAFAGPQLQTTLLFNPKDCTWKRIGSSPTKCEEATAVFCDHMMYITGGRWPHTMPVYNVLTKEWLYKSASPIKRDFLSACSSEGKIYTSGGSVDVTALDVFECFDTKTGSWQEKPNMLTARCCHGSVEVDGLIYVCGGTLRNNASGRILNNCEVYDPSTQRWRRLCGMKEARKNHGLVVVHNKIYAVGGQGATGGLDSVEYYDIASNKWFSASPIPWKGASLKCAAVEEIIYVLSGKEFERKPPLKDVLKYHTRTDRWLSCGRHSAIFPPCLIGVIVSHDNEKE